MELEVVIRERLFKWGDILCRNAIFRSLGIYQT